MGFFGTIADGYKIMWSEFRMGWQRHGAQALTGTGTTLMLIANGLMAKRGASGEVQQAIADAEATIAEIKQEKRLAEMAGTPYDKKENRKHKFQLAKAKGQKYVSVGKHFWKEALVSGAGAVMVGAGQHMNTTQKTALATACAAVSAEFAAYRANVVADQGEEKDFEYMTTKTTKNAKKVKMEDGTVIESVEDDGMVTVPRDDSIFSLHYSRETTPSIYSDNLTMRIADINFAIESILLILRRNGYITLNDMRRQFARNADEREFDVALGGIYGIIVDKNDPEFYKKLDFGYTHDQDFMEGRKEDTYIIFPCNKEPIISKIKPKLMAVETGR